ncbi:reverse transcriptase family protein [Pseudosulfitobacter pseudonitzschiae]|uniref:reverse transcriptase family protein n=1 Tax=Pseudosulfitobacter pseudonitzschiae TaxID=1402135 RepID=UPI003B81B63E
MRFPHPDLEKICFIAEDPDTLIKLLGEHCTADEAALIQQYCACRLPPISSPEAIATMFGYNPGFVWFILTKTDRHYRTFSIPKGKGERQITAPRVALKLIQRWLNFHWSAAWVPPDCVHGFVSGRSHITAATEHCNAKWIVSADIKDFFPSVKTARVRQALAELGYTNMDSLALLGKLVCLNGALTQGAPTSPLLSNIVLGQLDRNLTALAAELNLVFTRYADDIVFSGKGAMPEGIDKKIKAIIEQDGWTVAEKKFEIAKAPSRLKVHGLLVHGGKVRLTKGYRNRLRAFRHVLSNGKASEKDVPKLSGHVAYADFIDLQHCKPD